MQNSTNKNNDLKKENTSVSTHNENEINNNNQLLSSLSQNIKDSVQVSLLF